MHLRRTCAVSHGVVSIYASALVSLCDYAVELKKDGPRKRRCQADRSRFLRPVSPRRVATILLGGSAEATARKHDLAFTDRNNTGSRGAACFTRHSACKRAGARNSSVPPRTDPRHRCNFCRRSHEVVNGAKCFCFHLTL